jgi:hypothetical protein
MRIKEGISELQDFYLLSIWGLLGLVRRPFYVKDAIEQMDYAGAGSFLIVLFVSLFIGMALSLQLAAELSGLGLKMYIGSIVGVSIIRILAAATSIETFSKKIEEGHGTVQKLMEDPSLYNQALTTISELEEFSKELKDGKGTLGKLITNPDLYENLDKDAERLSSILEKIEESHGLLGALTKDEKLTKETEDILLQLKELIKDIKENPKKYFQLRIF